MKKPSLKFLGWAAALFLGVLALGGTAGGEAPATPPVAGIEFTADERAWIAAHPVIRAGHDISYEPYAIKKESGKIVGIDPDYLEIITQRTGLKFENQFRRDWFTMLEAFKAHEVDLLLSLGLAAGREQFLIYSDSYSQAPNVIVTRNDSPYLFSLEELKGKKISIPRGYAGLRLDLALQAPGNIVVEYDSALECYQAVARGEVFAATGNIFSASHLIRSNQLTNLRLGSVSFTRTEMYLGVRKDWPMLAKIINKVLASITPEERKQINSRWVTVDYATDQWWVTAFRIAAGIAAVALLIFSVVWSNNRRLSRELAARRHVQAELEQVRDKLERASREKNELMHMLAHDLRSPLTGIQLGVELLQFDPPPAGDDLKLTTGQIKQSVGKMARLINDLISAQNLEEGHFALKFSAGDAGPLVDAAVAAVRASAAHKRITVSARPPDRAVALTTDFVALQQVVDNLLSNALKYSPANTTIEVTLAATATQCRLEVRDQGPGVPPAEREKIFEKFGRGSARPAHGEESTGLGLWIVRRFVTALHGKVWCEAGPDSVGSVFVVEIPLLPQAA